MIEDFVNFITNMWNEHTDFTWWQMLLIGLFFTVLNLGCFWITWVISKGAAEEYGFGKYNGKKLKKMYARYSFWDKLLLIRITHEAKNKGPYLYFNLLCYWPCLIAMAASFVGFIGCMITLADGWAFTLLALVPHGVWLATGIARLIPDTICLPSVRKRYRL